MKIKQIICILLTFVMLVATASCVDAGNGDITTENNASTAAEVTSEPEDTSEKLSIPDDFNLGGNATNILYWDDVENPEFFVSDDDLLDKTAQAIKDRNAYVEDRMKTKLNFIGEPGRNNMLQSFSNRVNASLQAGDHEFDIIAAYSQTMANCAYNNYLYDLNTTKHLDFTKSWWPSLLTKEATIFDRLFFISGDISTNMLHMMYVVFFNKNLLETRTDLESPYELVAENEWTVDKIIEMSQGFYSDLDSDGKKSSGDRYGFVLPKLSIDAFFYGSNLRTTDKNAEGALVMSETYFSEKAQSLLEKLSGLCFHSDDGMWELGSAAFSKGNALFDCERAVEASKSFGEVDFEYGVVPAPKWDKDQEAYYTCAGNPITMYGIIANSDNSDENSAVLECWGYEASKTTTPAIFEVTMKIRFAKDSDTARMYDMIRDGVTFDIGRMFGITMGDLTQTLYRNAMSERPSWTIKKKLNEKRLNSYIEKVNEVYGK